MDLNGDNWWWWYGDHMVIYPLVMSTVCYWTWPLKSWIFPWKMVIWQVKPGGATDWAVGSMICTMVSWASRWAPRIAGFVFKHRILKPSTIGIQLMVTIGDLSSDMWQNPGSGLNLWQFCARAWIFDNEMEMRVVNMGCEWDVGSVAAATVQIQLTGTILLCEGLQRWWI